ncbi:glutamate-5-semialdehyde dehydrogenase [Candidatus Woesearchaeota archaeon]|nr:glutamate-5-semialdehyde dehydrogenase [Candidatus Woesearchaeota archaeon]
MNIVYQAKQAKESSIKLAAASSEKKNATLENIAKAIDERQKEIITENKKDLEKARKENLSQALLKRLKVDGSKIDEMVISIRSLIKLKDPVGETIECLELDEGLDLYRVRTPIGVIGVIFESRPDALVQIATLCLKSGNAVILKGGSEALHSNRILSKIIKEETDKVSVGCTQLIETREDVKEILALDNYIDLLIPRGSNKFVKFIQDNSKIPVLGHSDGICHTYVDKDADFNKAVGICFDAKCQYPAVCNAMETLLVHKDVAKKILVALKKLYDHAKVELKGDKATQKIIDVKVATEEDWSAEYNDLILSIKIVKDVDEAISHINKYGSKHSDAIITENEETARKFTSLVDSSSVMWNASTRFADGYRYGKGAEVGISTNKIHARGPVGLEGMMIYKYVLNGKGHVVKDYTGDSAKSFTHKKVNKKW